MEKEKNVKSYHMIVAQFGPCCQVAALYHLSQPSHTFQTDFVSAGNLFVRINTKITPSFTSWVIVIIFIFLFLSLQHALNISRLKLKINSLFNSIFLFLFFSHARCTCTVHLQYSAVLQLWNRRSLSDKRFSVDTRPNSLCFGVGQKLNLPKC